MKIEEEDRTFPAVDAISSSFHSNCRKKYAQPTGNTGLLSGYSFIEAVL